MRVFTWLICEGYDNKGNVIVYGYKDENSDNVDLSQVHKRNRTDLTRSANRSPYLPTLSATEPWPMRFAPTACTSGCSCSTISPKKQASAVTAWSTPPISPTPTRRRP